MNPACFYRGLVSSGFNLFPVDTWVINQFSDFALAGATFIHAPFAGVLKSFSAQLSTGDLNATLTIDGSPLSGTTILVDSSFQTIPIDIPFNAGDIIGVQYANVVDASYLFAQINYIRSVFG